jgi:hypothetical protein
VQAALAAPLRACHAIVTRELATRSCSPSDAAREAANVSEALDEMVAGGFVHRDVFDDLREVVARLDPPRLRADAGPPPRRVAGCARIA